ncbi:MAG: hypothetical protein IKN57_01675, partial [Parasporobacterium sp.]|nr:hypothetical protein [Parasporobacterium sp.]
MKHNLKLYLLLIAYIVSISGNMISVGQSIQNGYTQPQEQLQEEPLPQDGTQAEPGEDYPQPPEQPQEKILPQDGTQAEYREGSGEEPQQTEPAPPDSWLEERRKILGQPKEAEAEWTVMFYMCGSDLESVYGFASQNLSQIISCRDPWKNYIDWLEDSNIEERVPSFYSDEKVNVLVQTGGASRWSKEHKLTEVSISSRKIQRWSFHTVNDTADNAVIRSQRLVLEDEQPLSSMGAPETLSDFIKWSVQKAPAKKYALVLWDHGGGSKTGVMLDELFDEDILYIYELSEALKNGGIHFETVIFDACMMANLETAYAVSPYASWMVGSEELVPGNGTAISEWLQELFNTPDCDGRQLGRNICDTTQKKYSDTEDRQSQNMLTWSVINLEKIEQLVNEFDILFKLAGYIYESHPDMLNVFRGFFTNGE